MLIQELMESRAILEKKLTPLELLKHDYLDQLIGKIEKGEELSLEPDQVEKYGMSSVVVDPEAIEQLRKWSKSKVLAKSPLLKIADSDQTIPVSSLSKSNVRSGLNLGIMSEGVLGAALVAKFLKLGKEITYSDVTRVLNGIKNIKVTPGSSSLSGSFKSTIKHPGKTDDKVIFELKLPNKEFEYLTKASTTDSVISKLLSSSVLFVNSSTYGIPKAIAMITSNADGNQIDVISDGISDNKGTKADLTLRINGKVIDLISLKAGSVKQFGQVSGGHNFAELIDDFFDIDLGQDADELIELSRAESRNQEVAIRITNQNYGLIRHLFNSKIVPGIEEQTASPSDKQKFITRLVAGISKHMTGDQSIHIVKLHATGGGGYTVLKLNKKKLPALMHDLDFSVVFYSNSNTLKIQAVPTDVKSKLYQELGGQPGLLLQIRSKMERNSYIRNIVEMGSVLESLITLETRSTPLDKADKPAKPLTKIKARFEPEAEPAGRKKR